MDGLSDTQRRTLWPWIVLLAVPAIVVVASRIRLETGPPVQSRARMHVVLDHLLEIRERQGAWPRCSGKNFVLSIVANGAISPHVTEQLKVLFSPVTPEFMWSKVDRASYSEVTLERLVAGEDFHELTSWAGRRNSTPGYELPEDAGIPEPLIADLGYSGFIMVGYTDGSVWRHSYEELGIPEGSGPLGTLRVGDDASLSLLRKLSLD